MTPWELVLFIIGGVCLIGQLTLAISVLQGPKRQQTMKELLRQSLSVIRSWIGKDVNSRKSCGL